MINYLQNKRHVTIKNKHNGSNCMQKNKKTTHIPIYTYI